MKSGIRIALIFFMQVTLFNSLFAQKAKEVDFNWDQLPAIPDAVGFAGSFAGISNDALIVAGGANFPDGGAPWTGSVKKWYDKVFVLEKGAAEWKQIAKLPMPLGYGVSISGSQGLICLGGSNESGHYSDAFIIEYKNGEIFIKPLPNMPKPNANACGALVDNVIYIAGGTQSPDAKTTETIFWSLDLSKQHAGWQELPSWPGPSRMLSVAGAHQGNFYLFSGTQLKEGKREYLTDAFKYNPGKGWITIANLPASVVAAPSTAYTSKNSLFVFGGDDGELAAKASELKEKHPGFSDKILAYDPDLNKWEIAGTISTNKKNDAENNPNGSTWAPVTTPLVVWNGKIILPGGEVRPATRTPRVLQGNIIHPKK